MDHLSDAEVNRPAGALAEKECQYGLHDTKQLTLRTLAMPADTNPAGDIFGGWVMAQMDLAAGIRGREVSHGRVVTAAVGELSFERSIHIGDTVCVYTEVKKIGTTSMTFDVDCFVMRQFTAKRERAVKAVFVMVALDHRGAPRPVLHSNQD